MSHQNPLSKEFKLMPVSDKDCNLNNLDNANNAEGCKGGIISNAIPPKILVHLISLALEVLQNEKGSSLNEIRKLLVVSGLIPPQEDLRRAMVKALKSGVVARPKWAVKSGMYGLYVKGDGVPIFAGRKKVKKSRKTNTKNEKESENYDTEKRSSRKANRKKLCARKPAPGTIIRKSKPKSVRYVAKKGRR